MVTVLNVEDLRGMELAGVAFIRDYVELLFDGPILRCYARPEVVIASRAVRFPTEGSRDALCELIGAEVANVRVGERDLSLDFDGDRRVRIEFARQWETGRDAAEFVPMVEGVLAPEQKLVW
jgi:hypothetical protein